MRTPAQQSASIILRVVPAASILLGPSPWNEDCHPRFPRSTPSATKSHHHLTPPPLPNPFFHPRNKKNFYKTNKKRKGIEERERNKERQLQPASCYAKDSDGEKGNSDRFRRYWFFFYSYQLILVLVSLESRLFLLVR